MALPVRGQAGEEFVAGVELVCRRRAALEGLAPAGGTHAGHASGGNALAIRRVHQQHTWQAGGRQALQRVAAAQLHGVGHAGPFGVALREIDHAVRDVAAEHLHRRS